MIIWNLVIYSTKAIEVYKLKASVKKWLDPLSSNDEFTVLVTDNAITISIDENKHIHPRSSIKEVYINQKYIYFIGAENIYKPAKSLSA
jgi:hypothetical protein